MKIYKKQFKNNKLKLIAPTLNDESELPDGSFSVSDFQNYIDYVITKHETLTIIPPIHIFPVTS